jgi:hypothetical protein
MCRQGFGALVRDLALQMPGYATEKRDYQTGQFTAGLHSAYAKLVPPRFPGKHRVAGYAGKTSIV